MKLPATRLLSRRYLAGEDLASALRVARHLNRSDAAVTLHHLGTHARSRARAGHSSQMSLRVIRAISTEGLNADISIKLTALGLDLDRDLCQVLAERIVGLAAATGVFVWIDMEEAPYVDDVLAIYRTLAGRFGRGVVGIAIQSYLQRSRSDLDDLIEHQSRIRLVKGGYWEIADGLLGDAATIEAAFASDIEHLLHHGREPAIATHSIAALRRAFSVTDALAISRHSVEIQMLHGVHWRRLRLARDAGFRVRCYVPFGRDWYEFVLGCARQLLIGLLPRR